MDGISVWLAVAIGLMAALLAACLISSIRIRRSQAVLGEENRLFDAALSNMAQGLNVFDKAGRLVLSNNRYIEMYGLSRETVKPGAALLDLVNLRLAAGTFFKIDPERYAAEVKALARSLTPTQRERELADGRVINVVNCPLAGGGWVVTHEDVTERWRAEREVESTHNFLQTVIENVPTTIVVKDARTLCYVLINRAAEEFYGVPREQMIGKTAVGMFSPRTAETITARDRQLLETGSRQQYGEHPMEVPGGGRRIARTTRMPVVGEDGTPKYLLTVIEDFTERRRAEARIERLAHYDALTDLPNRTAFNECFASVLEHATTADESFAVLSVDLDHFKEVNDVFGHAFGDRLLRAVAERLSATVAGAFLSRIGGDEFGIIVSEGAVPNRAARLAERLLAAAADEFEIEGHRLHIGLSVGIAIYPLDGVDSTALLGNADAALDRAKAEGRGVIRFFEAQMDHRLRGRRALLHDMRSALEQGRFLVHYQPQARIDGEIIGFEALARWNHPTRGHVPPSEFIPLAEESGLIAPIGEWILRAACREAATWPPHLHVAVNLSPVQFRHGDLAGLVHQVLIDTGLAPNRLELEITESVLIDDLSRALSILRRLKALGVRIAMDDFGTGYSSLSTLQAFPFDKIKIDRSFIANLERNVQSATIVRAVLALGRGLNLPVVAEGVETQAQLAFLSHEDCAEVQGYLLGRPLPIEDYAGVIGRSVVLLPPAANVA